MNTHEHIDELAELYALGALDDRERASIDLHVHSCRDCAARLGEAERFIAETVAPAEPSSALDVRIHAAFAPARRTPPRWGALVAAAFVIGLLPGIIYGVFNRPAPSADPDRDRAIAALVNSHFLHAQFTPLVSNAPKAKVIYGRSAPWRYFIAQTNHAYVVRTQSGTELGTLHVNGNAAELFVPSSSERSFVLFDGSTPVATVTIPAL